MPAWEIFLEALASPGLSNIRPTDGQQKLVRHLKVHQSERMRSCLQRTEMGKDVQAQPRSYSSLRAD